jgi:dipeptidyl-peptidase-4
MAYWQFDTSGVERFTLVNNTDSLYPTATLYAYPKTGTRNSAVRVGIVASADGPTRWVKAPGDAREHYIPRMDWVDSATLALSYTVRRQNATSSEDSPAPTPKRVWTCRRFVSMCR